MGLLHYFLGLQVHQTEEGIFLSQRKYARDLLNKFGMLNCKHAATPMNISEKLQQVNEEELTDARRFRILIYLTHTRPDIAYHVGVISRFMQQPSKVHYGAAKRVLRYIAGTLDFDIWYSKTDNFRLCGYTDSDWASSLDDKRSVSANVFTLGSAKEEILLEYCSTQEQLADVLTKALSKEKFCYFRGFFGVCTFESRGNVKE
ncbi:uncharacterized mitochondrial protein AtMg00810-like [Solanum tuberosum]|uniref:uncharacterized mitochondrial protein AtMg00810-like n=1 Tax=Solanum tuberosum TaxID=4113 RepID=UPI00073A5099|nr:PREDICTED: uncharacterized mitochondrial protein AtMg00810-like [Solanum tuberosum]